MGGQDRIRPTVFYPAKQALGARQFSFVVNFISLALPVPRGPGAFRDAKWRKGGGKIRHLAPRRLQSHIT